MCKNSGRQILQWILSWRVLNGQKCGEIFKPKPLGVASEELRKSSPSVNPSCKEFLFVHHRIKKTPLERQDKEHSLTSVRKRPSRASPTWRNEGDSPRGGGGFPRKTGTSARSLPINFAKFVDGRYCSPRARLASQQLFGPKALAKHYPRTTMKPGHGSKLTISRMLERVFFQPMRIPYFGEVPA